MEENNSEFEQVELHELDVGMEVEIEAESDWEPQPGSDVEQNFGVEENVVDDEMEATDGANIITVRSAEGMRGDQIEVDIDYDMIILILICIVLVKRIIRRHNLDVPANLLGDVPEDVPRPAERGSSEHDGQNE